MLLAPVVKDRRANTPKRWKTRPLRAISARASTVKCAICPIRRSWSCKRNTPSSGGRPFQGARRHGAAGIVRNRAGALGRHRSGGRWTTKADELLFSANFACPICGYSAQLEPRLFSFNNPAGACPTCDGWACSSSSIRTAWCKTPSCRWPAAQSAAGIAATSITSRCCARWRRHYEFDVEAPFSTLSANVQKAVLSGSGKESIEFKIHQRSR